MVNRQLARLITELRQGNDRQRRAASYKLGKIRDPAAVSALIDASDDKDSSVRQNVVDGLRAIGSKEALDFVTERRGGSQRPNGADFNQPESQGVHQGEAADATKVGSEISPGSAMTNGKARPKNLISCLLVALVGCAVLGVVVYVIASAAHQDCLKRLAQNADLQDCMFLGDDLKGRDLRGRNLASGHLGGIDLEQADLSGANLTKAELSSANLQGANLSGADLTSVSLVGADLQGAVLAQAILRDASLQGGDLSNADVRNADLSHAILGDATLRNANLAGANLTGCDFRGADLTAADLTGATLDATAFQGAKGFTLEDLAKWLKVDPSETFAVIRQKGIILEDREVVEQSLRSVCDGAILPDAGTYKPDAAVHPFEIVADWNLARVYEDPSLSAWKPPHLSLTQLVICVGNDRVTHAGDCQYDKGALGIQQHYRDLRFISPGDGAVIISERVYGSEPGCPSTAILGHGVASTLIEGKPVTVEDLLQAIGARVRATRLDGW